MTGDPARTDSDPYIWLSLHARHHAALYSDASNDFLSRVILPLVHRCREEFSPLCWFFIRYDDADGPHFRIRLFLRSSLVPDSYAFLKGSIEASPMCTGVDLREYERELNRYGGSELIEPAERLFTASSDLVCGLALRTGLATPQLRLGAAMATLATAAWVIGGDRERSLQFAARYGASYRPALDALAARTGSGLTQHIDRNRAAYAQTSAAIVAAMEGETELDSDLESYRLAFESYVGTVQRVLTPDEPVRMAEQNTAVRLHQIVASQIHMTNNRLGISIAEEAFVGSILGEFGNSAY